MLIITVLQYESIWDYPIRFLFGACFSEQRNLCGRAYETLWYVSKRNKYPSESFFERGWNFAWGQGVYRWRRRRRGRIWVDFTAWKGAADWAPVWKDRLGRTRVPRRLIYRDYHAEFICNNSNAHAERTDRWACYGVQFSCFFHLFRAQSGIHRQPGQNVWGADCCEEQHRKTGFWAESLLSRYPRIS